MRALNASFTLAWIYGLLGYVITRFLMERLLGSVFSGLYFLP